MVSGTFWLCGIFWVSGIFLVSGIFKVRIFFECSEIFFWVSGIILGGRKLFLGGGEYFVQNFRCPAACASVHVAKG